VVVGLLGGENQVTLGQRRYDALMKELTPEGQAVYPKDTHMPENTDLPQGPILPEKGLGDDTSPKEIPPAIEVGGGGDGGGGKIPPTTPDNPSEEPQDGGDEEDDNSDQAQPNNNSNAPTVSSFSSPEAIKIAENIERMKKASLADTGFRNQVKKDVRSMLDQDRITDEEAKNLSAMVREASLVEKQLEEVAKFARSNVEVVEREKASYRAQRSLSPQLSQMDTESFEKMVTSAAEETAWRKDQARRATKENREGRPSANAYEQLYIDAQKAIIGEVDENGDIVKDNNRIRGKKSMEDLKNSLQEGPIRQYVNAVADAEEKDWTEDINSLMVVTDEADFREKLKKFVDHVENIRAIWVAHQRNFNPPSFIQEIAQDVVATDLADFQTGGKYSMFKRVLVKAKREGEEDKEVMKFQQENFIMWARSKMQSWEDNNPDDPQDMFKLVGIFGAIRGVNLGEMILTPTFFRDRDSETGEILEDLRTRMIYASWVFGYVRDSDIGYRSEKGSDDDLGPKAMAPIYAKNTLTKPGVFNYMVNMEDVMDYGPKDPEQDSHTGQALRRSWQILHDLSNKTILEKVLKDKNGEYLAFFDNRRFLERYIEKNMYLSDEGRYEGEIRIFGDRYSSLLFRKNNGEQLSQEELSFLDEARKIKLGQAQSEFAHQPQIITHIDDFFKMTKSTSHLFDSEGKLKKDSKGNLRIDDFIRAINVYSQAKPPPELATELRERIRHSVMELELKTKDGFFDYRTAEWVETWAYKMARFTGVGARNDINSIGFDSYSKTLNTGYYAQHQSLGRRGGAYGNKYTLNQMKRLGVDFYSITDQSGVSILERLQGGQGDEVDYKKRASVMSFGENTMNHFYSDHVLRTFNELHELMDSDGIKLHEQVKRDLYGRIHVNQKEFNAAFRDKYLKNMRYPYSTHSELDFTEEVMMFEEDVDPKTGQPIPNSTHYVSRPIARHLFGKEMFRKPPYDVMLKYEELDPDVRLQAKRYYQLEKRIYDLPRNNDADIKRPDFAKLSQDERKALLDKALINDTQDALTQEEREFLYNKQDWYYGVNLGGIRKIVEGVDDAFRGSKGRSMFWKEVAKVRLAAEVKEARKRFGNVQKMMSFEQVEAFWSAVEQLDADVYGDEESLGSAEAKGKVFDSFDIKWMRSVSGTNPFRMAVEDIGVGVTEGSLVGIWKAFMYLLGASFK